jgi:hypothetical protein
MIQPNVGAENFLPLQLSNSQRLALSMIQHLFG